MSGIKIFLTACVILFGFNVSGQKPDVDSLLSLLRTMGDDTNKVEVLNSLAWEYKFTDPDTAIIVSTEALMLSEKFSASKNAVLKRAGENGIVSSSRNLGAFNYLKSNYPQALKHYFTALKILESRHDKKGIQITLGKIGLVYWAREDFANALDYYFKALSLAEEVGNKREMATMLGNIAGVYMYQGDSAKEKGNDVFARAEKYPLALRYSLKSLKMSEQLGNREGVSSMLGNIGTIYSELQDYKKALDYFLRRLEMDEASGNNHSMAINLGNLGSLYVKMNKFREAELFLSRALEISKSIGDYEGIRDVNKNLSDLYYSLDKHQLAFEHYKNYVAARDNISNEENTRKQTRLEMQFEFDKKQAADSVRVAEEKKVAAAELKTEKNKAYSLYGGLALVLIFSGFIYNRFRVTSKQKKIIEVQKQLVESQKLVVEEKNKDILDSIYYARRIQRSLLPNEKYIAKSLEKVNAGK